jgi:hypothetical protein
MVGVSAAAVGAPEWVAAICLLRQERQKRRLGLSAVKQQQQPAQIPYRPPIAPHAQDKIQHAVRGQAMGHRGRWGTLGHMLH